MKLRLMPIIKYETHGTVQLFRLFSSSPAELLLSVFPFTNIVDVTGATADFDDPTNALPGRAYTVWYQFTTKKKTDVYLSTLGSDYWVNLSVYTGTRGNLKPVAADDVSVKYVNTTRDSRVMLILLPPRLLR
jgi:hypothetical protein